MGNPLVLLTQRYAVNQPGVLSQDQRAGLFPSLTPSVPQTIALQHLMFGQSMLGTVTQELCHKICLGIVLGREILTGDLNVISVP